MKALWICNLITSEFSQIYNVNPPVFEGWISGLFDMISESESVEVAMCFPIRDESRMLMGRMGGLIYYSFHASVNTEETTIGDSIEEFRSIYENYKPDVIHIWGTEYRHSYAAVCAAEQLNIRSKVITHIQGLVSAITPYYNIGIPEKWKLMKCNGKPCMRDNAVDFQKQGLFEVETIKKSFIVLGRTTWDRSYIFYVAPETKYRKCGEVLRKEFYLCKEMWNLKQCKRHSIFICQAGYPVKGLHLILPAIRTLVDLYDDIQVSIAGHGALASGVYEKQTPYDRYLLFLIDMFDLKNHISFVGKLLPKDMIEYYLSSHVFVSSSTIENSSNSIGEAQFLGVPVVATYTGGTPDLIEHGKSGLLYQMDAGYMFISCIRKIFEDDDYAEELSMEERKQAAARYDVDSVYNQLMDSYNELLVEARS
ncbi:Glycosyl transferases group 1 [Lachnospiraceae bacterium XBB2008]|nr:Glycosyl transferases group 1 [Lachnospiraceae bacterium XBB2008]